MITKSQLHIYMVRMLGWGGGLRIRQFADKNVSSTKYNAVEAIG